MTSKEEREEERNQMRAEIGTTKFTFGKTKIDKTMRISLIKDVAEILNADIGDEIRYELDGSVIKISKVVDSYKGREIEEELYLENILRYLKERAWEYSVGDDDEIDDYEEAKREYIEMMNERKNKKKN